MPATPTHVVRRADGSEAGALFDLASQRKVGLQVTDPAFARLLADHGILPSRPQRNWFLAAPLADAAAALEQVLRPAGYILSRT